VKKKKVNFLFKYRCASLNTLPLAGLGASSVVARRCLITVNKDGLACHSQGPVCTIGYVINISKFGSCILNKHVGSPLVSVEAQQKVRIWKINVGCERYKKDRLPWSSFGD